jgi:hypothetical protein
VLACCARLTQSAMPSCRAASTLAWPAIRPPSSPTRPAMAFNRWITQTAAGKTAYAEDRHAALTEACKVYRRGSQVAPSSETGRPTDDDDDPESAADPMAAEDQIDDDADDPEAAYRALMRKAEELAAQRGITQAQAFEKLLTAREPELRSLVKCARGR